MDSPPSERVAASLDAAPNPWQVREQIDRLAAHPTFSRSPTSLKLLRFFGDNIVSAGGRPVSQKVVADVLLGMTNGFKPTENPLVRMQVVRLRRKLIDYYAADGAGDAVLVKVPRGRYCLDATWNPASAAGGRAAGAAFPGDAADLARRSPESSATAPVRMASPDRPVVLVFEFADGGLDPVWRGLSAAIAARLVPNLLGHRGLLAIGPLSRRRADLEAVRTEEACDRYHADYLLDGQLTLERNALVATLHLLPRGSELSAWTQWCAEELAALPAALAANPEPDAETMVPPAAGRVGAVGEMLAGRIATLLRNAFTTATA